MAIAEQDKVVKLDTSAHWYDKDGNPCHTYVNKKGETKDMYLREARKRGLGPSFSGIESITPKPQLVRWQKQLHAEAAVAVRHETHLSNSEFLKAVVKKAEEMAEAPRRFGVEFHLDAERVEKGLPAIIYPDRVSAAREAIREVYGDIKWTAEKTFYCDVTGVGGCVDLISEKEELLLDYKTKDFILVDGKPNKRLHYDNQARQLAFYRFGNKLYGARCANVFVSNVTNDVWIHEWDQSVLNKQFNKFLTAVRFWKEWNEYDPTGQIIF